MNAAKATAISLAALFLARGPALTGCGTSTGDTPTTVSTTVLSPPVAASHPAPDGQWVVTDTYYDPEFGRTTVICVDHHGDLQSATGWREIAAAAPIGAPCPAGAVLTQTTIAWP